ncbi:TniQ protein [Paenibacillus algorifonticola]|uniref:TniQ protein n=1 Tax=Paenibacillus algorifonticola TaxID=684063 RepID=A0A1I2IVI7_9BACL|nr:TniQ family protein [Paenibacillus algorifonticola]SFF45017.1 TniQ protein [Paenibacillus algorifonticola]
MSNVYNKKRISFGTWNLTEINVPERSKLHSLEPIGVGTEVVESLTSYIGRLAESHNITTGVLLKNILGPQSNKKYLFEVKNQTKNPNSFRDYINNYGVIAREFVLTIEQLTLRNDIQYLTLVPWNGFVGKRRLL